MTDKVYCSICKKENEKTKRLNLTEQIDCKWCKEIFCVEHKYIFTHNCKKYNKEDDRLELMKKLVKVVNEKIIKI